MSQAQVGTAPSVEETKLNNAQSIGQDAPVGAEENVGDASVEALEIVDVVLTEFSNRGFFNLDNVQYDLLMTIKNKAAKRVEEIIG